MAARRQKIRKTRARVEEGQTAVVPERPYHELAVIYDELVGETAFEFWRENFDRLVARYGIEFESAADIACGTGLAVAYLSAMCDRVYGVDISTDMLEVARFRVRDPGVVFLEQSFTTLELPEPVDLLTCNFDSLNYVLTEAEIEEAITRFWRSLKQGGHCIFDMNTTRELEAEWGTSVFVHRVSNGLAVWESDWDRVLRINTLRMTNFIERGDGLYSRSEEVHRERSYELDYLVGVLRAAGFARVEAYDAKGLTGVNEETRRVQFLARK